MNAVLPPGQPTMCTLVDGDKVYTITSALWILAHEAIPAYVMATGEWLFVDREMLKDAEWMACGTFGDRPWVGPRGLEYPRIGEHLPREVAAEMLAWCETWLRENPDRPAIPAITEAYQRNTYRTTKTVLLTYTQWTELYERYKGLYDRGSRAGIPRGSNDVAPEPREAGEGWFTRDGRRTSAKAVAMAARPREDSLFDEDRG